MQDSGAGGDRSYRIDFVARAASETIACGAAFAGMGIGQSAVRVRDFRLFVSNVRLVGPDGEEVPLSLEPDGIWQSDGVALLDFEDGSDTCSETGNGPLNTSVRGTAPIDQVTGLGFDLGVPFELNHLDVATRPAPLNLVSMFWNWRGGYKFIRIDLEDDSRAAPDNRFNIHLGSTACPSAAPVVPPSAPCARPNLPEVRLDGFDPGSTTVVLDLAGLLEGVDTSTNTPMTAPGCMSNLNEPEDCSPLFQNLGLSFDTGACEAGCAGQRFVRLE